MKKLAVPFALLIHLFCNLVYFYKLTPEKIDSFGWAVFFHGSWSLCFGLMMLAIYSKKQLDVFDKLFIGIEFAFCLIMGIAFVANYYGCIQHTCGFCITIASVILTIFLLAISL